MTRQRSYPSDSANFGQIVGDVERVLNVESRLPAWPFRAIKGNADICQFSLAIEDSFSAVLQSLVDAHRDESISLATFDPTPTYYRENYGSFPGFRLSAAQLSRNYWNAVSYEPDGDPTGSLAYTANVVGNAGASGAWAVWAERSWDLAIIVSQVANGAWRSVGVEFVSAEEAIETFTAPEFKLPLSTSDLAVFMDNVRMRGRL